MAECMEAFTDMLAERGCGSLETIFPELLGIVLLVGNSNE
jgi:hypothetical protein